MALVIRFAEKVNLGSKRVSVNGGVEINRDRKGFRPSLRPHQKEGQCSRFWCGRMKETSDYTVLQISNIQ